MPTSKSAKKPREKSDSFKDLKAAEINYKNTQDFSCLCAAKNQQTNVVRFEFRFDWRLPETLG